jgi:hypothetical protein
MKSSNWLAKIFEWNQQVIEAAETPFSRLAIFILPILSPIVPALMTGLHIHKLLLEIFAGDLIASLATPLAGTVGTVLELIGYVGAVLFIQSIYKWIQSMKASYFVPMVINGLAYMFYLYLMWMINYRLGVYFKTPEVMNQIVGWLSFMTVPTGLLAANHLSQRDMTKEDYQLRQERREDKLKNKALDKGINIFAASTSTLTESKPQKEQKQKHASDYREKIWAMLDTEHGNSGRVLSPKEITTSLKLEHSKNKGYVSTQTSAWMKERGVSKNSGHFTL